MMEIMRMRMDHAQAHRLRRPRSGPNCALNAWLSIHICRDARVSRGTTGRQAAAPVFLASVFLSLR